MMVSTIAHGAYIEKDIAPAWKYQSDYASITNADL